MPGPTPPARPDLAALVAHYRDLLGLQGWEIRASWSEGLDCLARVIPTPTRRIAVLEVSVECPPEELRASIVHELVHVLLSPLTAVSEPSDAAVMLEEQAVEALALALVAAERSPADAPVLARVLARIPQTIATRARARASGSTSHARKRGGLMDPKLVLDLLNALIDGNGEALAEAAKQLIAYALGGAPAGDAAPEMPPEGEAMMSRLRARLAAGGKAGEVERALLDATGAKTIDAAFLRVAAGKVALDEIAKLRASGGEDAAAADLRARRERLASAMQRGALSRAQAFENPEETEREKLKPRGPWMRGSLEDLDEALAALGSGARARAPALQRKVPGVGDEAGLADRARASGMTLEQRRQAEENVRRNAAKG